MDTALKSFLDKFRAKPEWQSPDPAVRAAAVLRLSAEERELVVSFAEDSDPRVRKAAVKKIHDPALLTRLAQADADPGVREEAAEALVTLAAHAQDEAPGRVALEGLAQAKHLLSVVRAAALPALRRAALEKIADAKALAAAAREAPDAELRLLAVGRLDDPGLLLGLAQHSELKPVALAAVEKLHDEAGLRAVAARAKNPAASRRARARLDADMASGSTVAPALPEPAAPPPAFDDEAEREAYERKLLALRAEQEARARALAERDAVCQKLEAAADELAREALDEARGAWEGLSPLQGSEAEALQRRYEAALHDCQQRAEATVARAETRAALEPLVAEAEALVTGEVDLTTARPAFAALQKRWQEAGGSSGASAPQRERLEAVALSLAEREAGARALREAQAKQELDRLKSLAGRLEGLVRSESLSLKDADRAAREAKDALDHLGALPAKKEKDALHARLEAARKALYPRLQALRADTEWKRWANESVQEELVARAEALRAETDLEKAGEALRDLDARWKAAAEVDKAKGESLWKQFKAARDEVKAKVDAWYAERAAEFAANLQKKEALIARAEALADSSEWLKTKEELKQLQAEWKEVGPTTHAPGRAAWERFRQACDRFFSRREEDLKQRKGEWSENEAKKQALIERAEALAQSTEWEQASAEVKKLQAEWKAVGAVKKTKSEALWQRFRAACDVFFERYKRRDQIAQEKSLAEREAILVSLEALLPAEGAEAPEGLAARVGEIQAAWRQAGPETREQVAFAERFRKALFGLVAAFPGAFKGGELDPDAARKKAEKLCARVEALAPATQSPALSLAEQLKEALATNTMGGRGEATARRKLAADEVRAAREAFARLPPLPGPEGEALRARFEAAAQRAVADKG